MRYEWGALAVLCTLAYYWWRSARCRGRFNKLRRDDYAVVTGASSGIGEAIAYQLAKRGMRVMLVGRRAEALSVVAGRCMQLGASAAETCIVDLTSDDDRARMCERIVSFDSRLALLVLCAGVGGISNVDASTQTMRIARDLMEINYFANLDLIRRLYESLRVSKTHILVVSSISGLIATPGRSQYCASKFAIQGFFNSLRMELAPYGVTVTTICPGVVRTPFHERVRSTTGIAPPRRGAFMPVDECAKAAVESVEHNKTEVVLTLMGKIGVILRPWMPLFVDHKAAESSRKTMA